MKYLFHTLNLAPTGGSRVILDLSELLIKNGHEVRLIIDKPKISFSPPADLRILHLTTLGLKEIQPIIKKNQPTSTVPKKRQKDKIRNQHPFLRATFKWTKYILKQFENIPNYFHVQALLKSYNPDLVVTHNMYTNLEHFFFYKSYGLTVVLHNSPREIYLNRDGKQLLSLKTYYKNVHCIGVANAIVKELKELLGINVFTAQTIYNPINKDIVQKSSENFTIPTSTKKYIVSVSSLSKRKRIERIIYAYSTIKDREFDLLILGEGPERPYLESIIQKTGLSHNIHLLGFIDNPYPYIKHAEALVLASDSEGLLVVLVESLYLNTPVVSTDCPTGPNELLTGELSKYLISLNQSEDKIFQDIANKVTHAIQNPLDNYTTYYKKFLPESIVSQWEKLAIEKTPNEH